MKKAIGISFLVIVILSLGVGIFFLFFAPHSNDYTYNQLLRIMEYKNRANIPASLQNLYDSNGVGENFEISFDAERHASIIRYRNKLYGAPNINETRITEEAFSFYSYSVFDESLDKALEQYTIYSSIIKNPTREMQNKIDKYISDYEISINQTINIISETLEYQKHYTIPEGSVDNAEANIQLTNYYYSLVNNYRNSLLLKAKLIFKLKDFVLEYSFNNNFSDLPITTLYDCLTYSVMGTTTQPFDSENSFMFDMSNLVDVIFNYNNGVDIFGEIGSEQFVKSFRNCFYNYKSGFVDIFGLSHEIKQNIVVLDTYRNSKIQIEFQADIRNILIVLGVS